MPFERRGLVRFVSQFRGLMKALQEHEISLIPEFVRNPRSSMNGS